MEHTVRNPELALLPRSCDLPSEVSKTSKYYEIIQQCPTTDIIGGWEFLSCLWFPKQEDRLCLMNARQYYPVLDSNVSFADCSNCGNVILADSQSLCQTGHGVSSFQRGHDGWHRTRWGSSTELGVFPLSEPVLLCGFLLHEMCH